MPTAPIYPTGAIRNIRAAASSGPGLLRKPPSGFTITEIWVLLDGFSEDTPPSERWRVLAREKLPEIEALVKHALGMKQLLERGLRCECLRLEDCEMIDSPLVSASDTEIGE